MESDLCLDVTAGGNFTHKTMTEQVKFLEHFLERHTSSGMKTRTLQANVMLSVEELSSVESKPLASIDLTHEPSPKPRAPKERLIHPTEFPIKFEDYGNTSKHSWHEKHVEKVSPKVEPSKELLMEVKCSSKAI